MKKIKKNFIKNNENQAPNTGNWRYMEPEVEKEKCIGCGICVKFCPEACITLRGEKIENKKASINYDFCKGCGVCAQVCPQKAIKMFREIN